MLIGATTKVFASNYDVVNVDVALSTGQKTLLVRKFGDIVMCEPGEVAIGSVLSFAEAKSKMYLLRIKNNIEQEHKLLCSEDTQILAIRNGYPSFITISEISSSAVFLDAEKRLCKLVEKSLLTESKAGLIRLHVKNCHGIVANNLIIA